MTLPVGMPEEIGPYRLRRLLGRGTYGMVFEVEQRETHTTHALKWMPWAEPSTRMQRLRLQREVDIASQLTHPNLVKMQAAGMEEGVPYCVMELIDGGTLREVIRNRPPGPWNSQWQERVKALGTPLFDALQYLHNHRIVHRDIKPENIFVQGNSSVRLGDFGLSVQIGAHASRSNEGLPTGTAAYMPPEMFNGADASRRTDLYSLGVVLFELITGGLPVDYDPDLPLLAIALKIISCVPKRLREVDPTIPEALDTVVARMIASAPEDRYFSASEAGHEWMVALGGEAPSPIEARVEEPMEPVFTGRERELDALAKAVELVAGGGMRFVLIEGDPGVGKSRLVSHFLRRSLRTTHVLSGRGAVTMEAPYASLSPVVREAIASLPNDWAESPEVMARVQAIVTTQPVNGATSATQEDARLEKLRIQEGVRRLLLRLSREDKPLLLSFDDAQWLDPSTHEVMDYLLRHWAVRQEVRRPSRVVIILTFRPDELEEEHAQWLRDLAAGRHLHVKPKLVQHLRLEQLQSEEILSLASSALGVTSSTLPPDLVTVLQSESGATPLGVMDLLHLFLQNRILTQRQGGWHWDDQAYDAWARNAPDLPGQRLEHTIARRIEALSPAEREVLTVAAVGQEGFTFDELAAVVEEPDAVLLDALDTLVAKTLLRERRQQATVRYLFSSRKVQQIALQTLTETRRMALERRWSKALVSTLTAQREHPDISKVYRLIEHCESCQNWEPALPWIAPAAEHAARVFAFPRAWQLYQKLLELDGQNVAIRQRAAELAWQAGAIADALRLLQELEQTPRIHHVIGKIQFDLGDYSSAVAAWERALQGLGVRTPPDGLAGAPGAIGAALGALHPMLALRKQKATPEALELCIEIVRASHFLVHQARRPLQIFAFSSVIQTARDTDRADLQAYADILKAYIAVLMNPPRVTKVKQHVQRVVALFDQVAPWQQIQMLRDLAFFAYTSGDLDQAEAFLDQGESIGRQYAEATSLCWILCLGGVIRPVIGDLPGVLGRLLEAQEIAWSFKLRYLTGLARHDLIYVYTTMGRMAQAKELVDQPQAWEMTAPLLDDLEWARKGMYLYLAGDNDACLALLRRSFKLSASSHIGAVWALQHGAWLARALLRAFQAHGQRNLLGEMTGLLRQARAMGGNNPFCLCYVRAIEAALLVAQDKPEAAFNVMESAAVSAEKHRYRQEAAWARDDATRLLFAMRDGRLPEYTQKTVGLWTSVGASERAQQLAADVGQHITVETLKRVYVDVLPGYDSGSGS
ncbi:MAG: protein kinase domain-containing protein [Candidatus Xenobia bacterium]